MRHNNDPFAQKTTLIKLAIGGRLRRVNGIHKTKAGQSRGTINMGSKNRTVFECAGQWHLSAHPMIAQ